MRNWELNNYIYIVTRNKKGEDKSKILGITTATAIIFGLISVNFLEGFVFGGILGVIVGLIIVKSP